MRANLAILLIFLLSFASNAEELILEPANGPIEILGGYLEYNQSLSSDATIAELQSAEFKSIGQPVANFGLGQGGIWLKLEVSNPMEFSQDWVLSLNRTLLDQLSVQFVTNESSAEILNLQDRLDSYQNYGTIATPFQLLANQSATLFILYEGANSSILTLSIETPSSVEQKQLFQLILFFASMAGVLTLIAYNTMMAVITRLPAFLYYGAAQIFLFAYFAHLSGFTTVYIWPETPELGNAMTTLSGEFVSLFNLLFIRSFVSREHIYPWISKSIEILIYSHAGFIVLLAVGEYFSTSLLLFNLLSILLIYITLLILPVTGVVASRNQRTQYWPMTAAWIWLSLSVFYTIFSLVDVAPVIPSFFRMYMGFAFIEAILLSVSLALAVRHIEQSRTQTQAALAKSLSAELEESKRSEQLMRERTVALNDLADRGRLLQAAGHDTRQALFALRQFSSGLDANADANRINTAKESIGQLVNHLDDVLATTLAGAHGGAMIDQVLAFERVQVNDLLEPIRLIYQRTAIQKGLRLLIHNSDAQVVTDRVFMIRILSNLVSNAIKYTDNGGLLIACRDKGSNIRLQVWDTGDGLSSEQLHSLLNDESHSQRFAQPQGGLGSGFQTCRELAKKLNIQLNGSSRIGKGSLFEVILPKPLDRENSKNRCILLDTDALTMQWLKNAGIKVSTTLPDSSELPVFIDYDYGGSGKGLSLAEELKDLFPNIVLTSYDHAADVRNAAAGAVSYLAYKPLEAETLQAIIFDINNRKTN